MATHITLECDSTELAVEKFGYIVRRFRVGFVRSGIAAKYSHVSSATVTCKGESVDVEVSEFHHVDTLADLVNRFDIEILLPGATTRDQVAAFYSAWYPVPVDVTAKGGLCLMIIKRV